MAAYNDWLTISPKTGTGNGTVTATILSHSGYSSRSRKVNFTATINGTANTKSVVFTQNGSNVTGVGMIKINNDQHNAGAVTPNELKASQVDFVLTDTNARDIQWVVEVVTGILRESQLTGILSAPSFYNTKITDVVSGSEVTLTTFAVATSTSSGRLKKTYSMNTTDLAKKFGEHQTYSLTIRATGASSVFTNSSSQPVTVRYSLAVLPGSATTPVEVSDCYIEVTYSGNSSFVVTGGATNITASGTTKTINVTAPSDVTWTATTTSV